jgi:hypothetical protein
LSSFINSISSAVSAFRSRKYVNSLHELSEAFELLESEQLLKIDSGIFNALHDALDITVLMAELPVFEKNEFIESTIRSIKIALQAFTKPEGGTTADILNSLDDFILLVEGMNVAMKYLNLKKFRADDFPPQVSFEISADGMIKLYVWTAEEEGRVAKISHLKAEFDNLFEKERKSKKYYLEVIDDLFEQHLYQECSKLMEQAMLEHESLKEILYVKMGFLLLKLEKAAEALDYFIKARVLGAPKIAIAEGIKTACAIMLSDLKYKSQRAKLLNFMDDFS